MHAVRPVHRDLSLSPGPGEASEQFNVRWVQRLGQLGLEGFEFRIASLRALPAGLALLCVRGVDIIANVRGMRSMMAGAGSMPPSLKTIAGSLHAQGNP